jgi:hypothetical protein
VALGYDKPLTLIGDGQYKRVITALEDTARQAPVLGACHA